VVRLPWNASLDELNEAASALSHVGLAGILVEPLQGRAGVRTPAPEFLGRLQSFSKKKQALFILDEVFTGFGRTGRLCADVCADLVCFGKAIGGGFPLSACVGRKEVMDAWPVCTSEALHTGTFFGHAFSCSVGALTIESILKEKLAVRARVLGKQVQSYLREQLKDDPRVKEIRGDGLMIGIEFTEAGLGAVLMESLRAQGVIVLPSGPDGRVLSITPALNIPENLLHEALDKIISDIERSNKI
jgi:4-aminobutyrate aminotransferase/(S)-3-amino-2-methylpropionate transaminase